MEKLKDETKRERACAGMAVFRNRKVSLRLQSKRHIPRIMPFRNKPSTKKQLPETRERRRSERKRREEGERRETKMPSINPGHN